MKSSHITAATLLVLAGGLALLWVYLRDDSGAGIRVEAEAPGTPAQGVPGSLDEETEPSDAAPPAVLREKIAPPEEAEDVAASPGPREIVRGRLRDRDTRDPLPDYLLAISSAGGHSELVTTDARGEFATATKFGAGTLTILFLDRPGRENNAESQRVDAPSGEALLDLTTDCGPTYWLDLRPARDIEGTAFEVRVRYSTAQSSVLSEPEPLRTGPEAWVRFGPLEGSRGENARGDSLQVASRDGYWRGSGKVQGIQGRVRDVVPVELHALAVLQVRVVDSSGLPVEDANLHLEWKTSAGKSSKTVRRSRADGTFRFEYLAPGRGTLAVRSNFHGPQDVPIDLVARTTSNVDVVLEKLPIAGAIRGRILSDTGTYTPKVGVSLSAPASPTSGGKGPAPLRTSVRWQTVDGREVGLFEFGELPKGEYKIDLKHPEDFFTWEPQRLVIAPPAEAAVFAVRDGVPNAGLALRVRDGDNGLLLDDFRVTLEIQGRGAPLSLSARSDQLLVEHMPLDRKITWRIDKRGYQPAFGDEASFIVQETRGGLAVRCAEIDLDPG
jgi:hypothetical protein